MVDTRVRMEFIKKSTNEASIIGSVTLSHELCKARFKKIKNCDEKLPGNGKLIINYVCLIMCQPSSWLYFTNPWKTPIETFLLWKNIENSKTNDKLNIGSILVTKSLGSKCISLFYLSTMTYPNGLKLESNSREVYATF